jgi:predicted  nucleic acid-binding Zn-ribbon protein
MQERHQRIEKLHLAWTAKKKSSEIEFAKVYSQLNSLKQKICELNDCLKFPSEHMVLFQDFGVINLVSLARREEELEQKIQVLRENLVQIRIKQHACEKLRDALKGKIEGKAREKYLQEIFEIANFTSL